MAQLHFTKNIPKLTASQKVFYEKNGYLLFPRLISQDMLNLYNKRFDDIIEGKAPRDGIIIMHDVKDKKAVNKMQDINNDPVFFESYIKHKDILDVVECFTGPNILAIHNMLIQKPPDIGYGSSKHPPHQDLYYFPFRPANRIVAAWTAMELCDSLNGCLFVSPGSHNLQHLYVHDYAPGTEGSVNKFYHGILDLPKGLKWVNLEMQPGDTVFFHPLLIHGSGINKSNRTRRAISCHYAAADCDKLEKLDPAQNRIVEEISEYTKKRFPGVEISYGDIWRFKSSLVRGTPQSVL